MCKTCTKCGVEKPSAEFSKSKREKDGLYYYCKACIREYDKKRYEENREDVLEQNKEWREKNKEQMRECRKKWREENPHLHREYNQRRRALKKAALPHLSKNDNLALKLLSEEVSMLGEGWHLDHIVPLSKGGLHHPDNLQIVRSSYNLSKNDKLWQERKYV